VPVLAVASLAAAGIGKVVLDVSGFSLLQRTVPAAARSGVFGLLEGLVTAALALGSIGASLLIAGIGASGAIVVGGAFPIVLAMLAWPILRSADDAAVIPERELQLLRGVPMLRPLQLTTIEQLAGLVERIDAPAGMEVVRQGDPGKRFFVVESGRLTTVIDGRAIGELGPGDAFGEIALIRDTPRTATVRAVEPSVLVALPREAFLTAVTGHADAFAAADEIVRGRLARA
ncbi:MAG TPA: cyclic nucleotide-binding domain-containing protein, partial [Candidatus Limnocylindrales bacterium]